MTPTTQRDRAAGLAKSNPAQALEQGRNIKEPWFRAQALSWVARFTDGSVVAIAAEAAKAAAGGGDRYQKCAVRAWEVAALAERDHIQEARTTTILLVMRSDPSEQCYPRVSQTKLQPTMRFLRFALIAASLFASTAYASPGAPTEGTEYLALATPQPVAATGKKVEVVEFFMYHCPHCNAFEPELERWVKQQGDKIVFRRVHIPYSGASDPEAHLFVTLEALGKSEEMQGRVFKAFHVDHLRLTKDDAIIDWVAKNGIDRKQFVDAWGSFGVMTKLRRLPQVIESYKAKVAPTVVIDGKYQTSPSMAQAAVQATNEAQVFGATLQIMTALVAKAAAGK